jgi:DNA-binding MarR family transcriptional regulator
MNCYEVLEQLKKKPEQNYTVNLLAKELNLTRSQVRSRLDQLEYIKLIERSATLIVDAYGIKRNTYVYKVIS